MSQVTEQSVRFQTALASIKLIQASAVLDLTEDDFDFMTSKKDWIDTDRYRDRCCIEPCMYGALDCVGFFFSSRSRHTICSRDWSSDVCSSDLSGGVSNDGPSRPAFTPSSDVARTARIPWEEGVYAGLLGPSFETPAEIRMLQRLGAD